MPQSTVNIWPYIAPFEVAVHNKKHDIWVSLFGKVFDITKLVNSTEKTDRPWSDLIAMAGKDISHWFDEDTDELQCYVDTNTGNLVPYCKFGRYPIASLQEPDSRWSPNENSPWWKDERYQIGLLTKRVRPLRIINMLISREVTINVCCEDTFTRIAQRYSLYNRNPFDYLWRYQEMDIDMSKTLDENGIFDERDLFVELGLSPNSFTPSIRLYYTDDLSILEEQIAEKDRTSEGFSIFDYVYDDQSGFVNCPYQKIFSTDDCATNG